MTRKLASEKVIVSAPLSFSGSAQRIWKITDVENPIAKFALALIAITLIMCAWMFVFVLVFCDVCTVWCILLYLQAFHPRWAQK